MPIQACLGIALTSYIHVAFQVEGGIEMRV
jgi:hypothetical protein